MSELNLTCEFDAKVWAKEWMRITKLSPTVASDEGAMIGWFSNAIMAGYDHAKNDGAIDALTARAAELEGVLRKIANYKPVSSVSFSWQDEWHYVRKIAKEVLK